MQQTYEVIGRAASGVAGLIIMAVVRGLVFMLLWRWFIEDKFSAPALNVPEALGIAVVIRYLTADNVRDDRSLVSKVTDSVVFSLLALLLGFIIYQFV